MRRPREDQCWAHQRSKWSRPSPKDRLRWRNLVYPVGFSEQTIIFHVQLRSSPKYTNFGPWGRWWWETISTSRIPCHTSLLLRVLRSCVFHLFPAMKRGCVTSNVALSLSSVHSCYRRKIPPPLNMHQLGRSLGGCQVDVDLLMLAAAGNRASVAQHVTSHF
jgi:hypothetical protein